jgi:M6 family metalloprotease-like protein
MMRASVLAMTVCLLVPPAHAKRGDMGEPNHAMSTPLMSIQAVQQGSPSHLDRPWADADGMGVPEPIVPGAYPDLPLQVEAMGLRAMSDAPGSSPDEGPAAPSQSQSPQIVYRYGYWTIEPFQPGLSLLEPNSPVVYGGDYLGQGIAQFPNLPVRGSATIPVFLVDWNDFDPATDVSNKNNPLSVCPGYVKKSPAELEHYLNDANGPAAYFREVSGGQLDLHFRVFPWIASSKSTYLADKEPAYYYWYTYPDGSGLWVADTTRLAQDSLRSAVVDLGVDLTQFDADGNLVMDGFVIVYEGGPGKVSGTNLSWTQTTYWPGPPFWVALDNVAALVAADDPHYAQFQSQEILFSRYCNIPEQLVYQGEDASGEFTPVAVWVHELGHLLLGYQDYYLSPTDLGSYALSAHEGYPNPFHPAAMEKWLFAKWIEAPIISDANTYVLADHHLKAGETYAANAHYLYRILINGDSYHYLTLENRYFLPASQGGSQFNEESPGRHPESGVVIFEVNRHLMGSEQIKRLLPTRCQGVDWTGEIGAFQPGDALDYSEDGFHIAVTQFSPPGPRVTFELGL